jgi:hypothetical protein
MAVKRKSILKIGGTKRSGIIFDVREPNIGWFISW